MLYLNPSNISDLLTVTLYEKCNNILNPYFTWKLTNKNTSEEVIFYQDDSSTSPYYYNSFTVSVVNTGMSLTSGVINVNYGEYEYEIYEKSTPRELTILLNDNLVESGLLIVLTDSTISSYFTGSDSDTTRTFLNL